MMEPVDDERQPEYTSYFYKEEVANSVTALAGAILREINFLCHDRRKRKMKSAHNIVGFA